MIFEKAEAEMAGERPHDPPPEYFFYLQYHVVRQRETELGKMLAGLDLSIAKWRILSTLNRLGRSAMGEVADFCAIDRTTLTRTMDQLVAAGYVERLTTAEDRRRTLLDLTDEGRSAYQTAVEAVIRFNDKAMRGVAGADVAVLERVLRQVVNNVIDDDAWARDILMFEKGAL
ncbi:MarR family winged helix-turn-helix transcriptional regulator [Caulobacter mirabilis]|nr:MarR family transcriptional regulator [Caulobacter mirabilis]